MPEPYHPLSLHLAKLPSVRNMQYERATLAIWEIERSLAEDDPRRAAFQQARRQLQTAFEALHDPHSSH